MVVGGRVVVIGVVWKRGICLRPWFLRNCEALPVDPCLLSYLSSRVRLGTSTL